MQAALSHVVGEHDFAGFARPGEQRGTVRTLLRAEVIASTESPFWAIVFEGRGFLRAMVRNLTGTAVAVGLGLTSRSRIREILEARGRYRGVRAPGWGLTLAGVEYDQPVLAEAHQGAPAAGAFRASTGFP
jgi:tRNA pseudouridine38-40 synthase